MKKTTLICLLAVLSFIPNLIAQSNTGELKPSFISLPNPSLLVQNRTSMKITGCTGATNGLFPSNTFTPNNSGNTETITNQAWAGQYSNVNVIANRQYRFLSSVSTDYITITNSTGTITYANGTQPVVWDSGSITGVIRYYLHTNANCGSEQVNRTRYVRCLDASNCVPPSNLAISNITSNSCKMTWTAASPVPSSNYDIYIITTNTAPDVNSTPTLFSTTNLTTSISLNVAAGTTYYYWIRSNCGATIGTWISGGSFTTPPALNCNGAVNGLYPDTAFTPACSGSIEQIVSDAYAGEYSNINILANKQYTFRSSVATDFITITNANGTAVLASGLTPLSWSSGTTAGVIRYHLHTNSTCGSQSTNRIKSIQCTNAISCGLPSGLSVSNITSNSCQISYTPPTPAPSSFEFYISTTSTAPISSTNPTFVSSSFPAIAYNLASSTTYYYWIRSNCNGTTSAWVSGGNFTTIAALICNGATYGIFPTNTFTPACTGSTEQITSTAWAGTYSNVNILSNNQYTFTSSVATDFITVTNATGTTVLASGVSPLIWNSNTTSGVVRYHLNTNANCGTQEANRIKSIKCVSLSCNPPSQLFSDGVTSTSINIGWFAPTPVPSNGYIYCYSTVNDPFSDVAITGNTTDTVAILSNLIPNTTYYFWVKSNCDTTQSNWISGGSFTTLSATGCNPPTQFWANGITSTTATVNWTPSTSAPNGGYLYVYNTQQTIGGIDGSTFSTTADLTNLAPNTTYYWWIAANCVSQGDWAYGGSFTTLAATTGCWKQISSGQQFTVAIKSDGSLWSWGANAFGQLGYAGSNNNQPSQIGTATNWKSISCGVAHTLAIKTDGTLWAWGNNFYGYLGDGTTVAKNTPVQIGNATNWKSVCAGYTHSFGIKNDGTLWAWGYNQYGQLGDGTTTNRSVPTQIGTATNWQSIGAGNSHSMGIKTNGTLWTWGRNDKGQLGDGTAVNKTTPTQIGTATNWQYIDGGISYTAALKTDGTIWTWGENTYGQLGQNDLVNRSTPTQVGTPNDTWEFVSAGGYHIVASKNYDAIFAWGRNDSGQLGNGTTTNTLIPTFLVDGIEWNAVSAGFDFSSAMSTNGDVHTWGNNSLGQLGNGTNTNNSDAYNSVTCPTTLDVTDFTRLANNVRTYPNPVKNSLTVSFDKEISTVSIFNLIGQEVIAKSLNSKEGIIEVSNLASGTYLVKVTSDGEVKTTKIIKE